MDDEEIRYFDVEGLPVTWSGYKTLKCFAWDGVSERVFPIDSMMRNGVEVSYTRFLELRVSSLVYRINRELSKSK